MTNEKDKDHLDVNPLQEKGMKTFDRIMKQILDLGQSSLSENQFQAFRKLTMDYFADGKRSFLESGKGRCGESKEMAREAVSMRV
jgi:hypothetical protein